MFNRNRVASIVFKRIIKFISVIPVLNMFYKNVKLIMKTESFRLEWTEQYCFTMSVRTGAVLAGLECNNTVNVVKCSNLK